MSQIHKIQNRLIRFLGLITIAAFGIVSTLGSGGGSDSDGSTEPTGVRAFDFTILDNDISAAILAKNTISLFPMFTELGSEMLNTLIVADPANSPYPLAICTNVPNGTAQLSWIDNGDGVLSTGDNAMLSLDNCDIDNSGETVSGSNTVLFDNVDVSNYPPEIIIVTSISATLTIPAPGGSITFSASFKINTTTLDGINYTTTYTAQDSAGQILSVSQNNEVLFKFGCFNVTQLHSIAVPGTYDLSTTGVINANNYIMSLASGPPVNFINDLPFSGSQRLLSMSSPNCGAVGVPNGVSDSNGAYIDIVFKELFNGDLVIKVFNINDQLLSENHTWWDVL